MGVYDSQHNLSAGGHVTQAWPDCLCLSGLGHHRTCCIALSARRMVSCCCSLSVKAVCAARSSCSFFFAATFLFLLCCCVLADVGPKGCLATLPGLLGAALLFASCSGYWSQPRGPSHVRVMKYGLRLLCMLRMHSSNKPSSMLGQQDSQEPVLQAVCCMLCARCGA